MNSNCTLEKKKNAFGLFLNFNLKHLSVLGDLKIEKLNIVNLLIKYNLIFEFVMCIWF